MGTESAVPNNLYSYSDQCTRAAVEFQRWVQTVLTPTIELYLRSSVPKQGLESVDLSAVTRWTGGHKYAGGGIAAELAKRIADAYYTDRDVRNTGRLFQEAGDQGATL